MPKRIPLITPFVTVCKAGMTIDGREVKAEWLKEAAETYNRELRDAPIDADHMLSWYGRFGTVDALRANTNANGETILEAKLEPNMRMLEQNSKGQRLHTSVHITKDNSPVSGKWYMVGLALTDNPAVNTTTELKFCSEDANEHVLRNSEFDSLVFLDNKEEFSTEELSTFKKLMSKFGFNFPTNNNQSLTNNPKEDPAINKEQIDAMLAAQGKTTEALASLTEAIGNKFKKTDDSKNNADDGKADDSKNNADDGKADDSKNNADDGKADDSKNTAAVTSEQFATLLKSVEGTNSAVAALTTTVNDALKLPGGQNTEFGANSGDGAADILY
jgi:Phage capsid scaffolding protein (GPO) serine peptidase